MESKQELIVLEQLPIIKTKLECLSVEIKEEVNRATSLVCNEDTYKDIKKVRASLTKQFNELEEQRKQVKNAIMSKYKEFEDIYVENVSSLYKDADTKLKNKIDIVEENLKKEKREELYEFFERYCEDNNLENFVSFNDLDLNINLSKSIKSLKEEIVEKLSKIKNDIDAIKEMPDDIKNDVFYEYTQSFDIASAIRIANERKKGIEKIDKINEDIDKKEKEEQHIIEKVEEIITPREIDNEIITVAFKIKGEKSKILEVKKLIKELGLEVE